MSSEAAKGVLATLNTVVRTYHLFESKLDTLTSNVENMAKEIADLKAKNAELAERVARLEESRATLKAEVNQEVTQVIADLRVRFAEQEAERRIEFERAVNEAQSRGRGLPGGG